MNMFSGSEVVALSNVMIPVIEEKIEQALASLEQNQLTRSQMIRIEALNIASREAVVRSYTNPNGTGGKTAVEIATEMVAFIEGGDMQFKAAEAAEIREESIRNGDL